MVGGEQHAKYRPNTGTGRDAGGVVILMANDAAVSISALTAVITFDL